VKPSTRNALVFAAKVLLAALLIAWLVRGGHLDVGALRILIDRPLLLAADLGLFVVGAFLATFRFRVLLDLVGVRVRLVTLLKLQMTAFFFNVVIPGNIGGDVVKALYVARDAPKEKRTTILLLAFVDRLMGVTGLVLMGALATLPQGPRLWADPLFRPLVAAIVGIGIATLVGGTLALVIVQRAGARLDSYTQGTTKISKLLNQLVTAARILSSSPQKLVTALGLSMLYHATSMAFFMVLTGAIVDAHLPYSAIATVVPLGLLSLLLPISPAGLGVGHLAFQRLFEAIGLSGGATVFNVYLLGQMAPSLLGIFPFLAMRRRGEIPTEAVAETKT
jgi:glycosyltransferase 2 family protein